MTRTPRTLSQLLGAIRPGAEDTRVSVAEVLHEIGERSFAAVILLPALLLVSPLSGIPGTPTLGGMLIALVALQWVVGRRHLWLPGWLLRRSVSAARLTRALDWLARPAAWIDRHSHLRIRVLTMPPFSLIPKLVILAVALSWPLLELLPMVTSVGALAVSLLSFGMMTRDGLYLALGYGVVGGAVALIARLLEFL